MPRPLYFLFYIIFTAIIFHTVCIPFGKWTLYLFIPSWLVGWFLIIGIVCENKHSSFQTTLIKGCRAGWHFFKTWSLYIGIMIAISTILAIVSKLSSYH